MSRHTFGPARAVVLLLAAASSLAQTKKPTSATGAAGPGPKITVTVASLFDRRTSGFPSPELSIALALQGEDAGGVLKARARVTRAVDDTGKSLVEASAQRGGESSDWQTSRGSEPPQPRIDLASPARKAKTLTAFEGVLETYSPSRDPAATVTIDRILTRMNKAIASPGLAGQHIKLQVLSKAALEKEKQQAEDKKKAEAAKKGAKPGEESVADAATEALLKIFERLFLYVGEHDLILKVDDPQSKIFSFDLAAADGKPVHSYGTNEVEGYRIVRMFAPIPEGTSLLVRLKTLKASGETPFAFADVKLP